MLFFYIGLGLLFIIFILNGFKTRCPKCGYHGFHKKIKKGHSPEYEKLKKQLDSMLVSEGNEQFVNDTGFGRQTFNCKKCSHEYNRKSSTTWLTISNKLGKEKAIEEYKKVNPK